MKKGNIRSAIEGLARRLEELGRKTDADNIRNASAKFYLANDKTMLLSTLETAKLILKRNESSEFIPVYHCSICGSPYSGNKCLRCGGN